MDYKLIKLNNNIDGYFDFTWLLDNLRNLIIEEKKRVVQLVKIAKQINEISQQLLGRPYTISLDSKGLNNVIDICSTIYDFYSYNIFMDIMCKQDRVNNVIEHTKNFLYFYFGVGEKEIKKKGGLLMTMLEYNITPF